MIKGFDELEKLIKSTREIILNDEARKSITVKGKADFVTQVDTSVQKYLKDKLLKMYPDIQFMGEEGEKEKIDFSKPVWILDPIDGTTNLIHDFKMSAVSLGLVDNGEAVKGIIYNPFHDEFFCGEKGKGAFLNGEKIHVTDAPTLEQSLIAVGTSPYNKEMADKNFEIIKELYIKSEDIRRTGSCAMDMAYVACGRIDGFFERNLKPWDYAAGCVIISEAGGCVTDLLGGKIRFDKNCDILAGNGKINNELLEVVNK